MRDSLRRRIVDTRGQATVEAAVCIPVAIVVGLIVYNMLRFASLSARFDRISLDTVIAQGISAQGETASCSAAPVVKSAIEQAMDIEAGDDGVCISVSEAPADFSIYTTYTCTLSVRPWPSSVVIAHVGYQAPAFMERQRCITVDRYRPGVLLKKE